MRQVLWSWGPLDIPSHEFFVGLGLLAGLVVFVHEARRRGQWDERLIPVLACLLAGGAIGARLAGMLNAATSDGVGAVAWAWENGGRSILGGLSGAYIGVLVGKRLVGYQGKTGDLFAPAAAVGIAVGRIGCFLAEAPGRPSDLPWAISVDPAIADSIPNCPGCQAGQSMHPSMLYEIVFLAVLALVLFWLRDRIDKPGELLPMFLASYAAFRFLVEFTRANEITSVGLTRSQLFILALSPLLLFHVVRQAHRGTYRGIRAQPVAEEGKVGQTRAGG